MAPPLPESTGPPERETLPITVELLEDIFQRLDSPVDLARASLTCRSFRQVITDSEFLRRYRAAHPPLLLGFVMDGFRGVQAPHPNAAAARAVAARAAGFGFDYLPSGGWGYRDVCEGRVLLVRSRGLRTDAGGLVFPELAVCDPLSRRFLLLPPVPLDLKSSVLDHNHKVYFFETFFVPSGSGRHEGTSFRVIARTHCAKTMVVFVFSSESGTWSIGATTTWEDLGLALPSIALVLGWPQYDHGCFYWKVACRDKLLKLDLDRMELSTVDLPPLHAVQDVVIAAAGEGKLGLFSHLRNAETVSYYTKSEGGVWRMERDIALPCKCCVAASSEGYVFLIGIERVGDMLNKVYFSLEVSTFQVERLYSSELAYIHVHPYFGFPPFMSSPSRI